MSVAAVQSEARATASLARHLLEQVLAKRQAGKGVDNLAFSDLQTHHLPAASVLLPVEYAPACRLRLAKLAVPRPRPEPLERHQLLSADSLPHAQQRQLAVERSWDFQS